MLEIILTFTLAHSKFTEDERVIGNLVQLVVIAAIPLYFLIRSIWSYVHTSKSDYKERLFKELVPTVKRWGQTYVIRDGYIFCMVCAKKSYHHKDIEYKYCAKCHKFHDQLYNEILSYWEE